MIFQFLFSLNDRRKKRGTQKRLNREPDDNRRKATSANDEGPNRNDGRKRQHNQRPQRTSEPTRKQAPRPAQEDDRRPRKRTAQARPHERNDQQRRKEQATQETPPKASSDDNGTTAAARQRLNNRRQTRASAAPRFAPPMANAASVVKRIFFIAFVSSPCDHFFRFLRRYAGFVPVYPLSRRYNESPLRRRC